MINEFLIYNSGVILVDEMSLSEDVVLNQKTMELEGFVNLGKYTPKDQSSTRAHHALVFMFQPFQGEWVQVICLEIIV